MARTARAVTALTSAGVLPALTAVDNVNGESIVNDGRTFLEVTNGSASPINVTITNQATVDGQAAPNRVVAVANATTKLIGPFPPSVYNDGSGSVWVDYSAGASVTAQAFKLPAVQ